VSLLDTNDKTCIAVKLIMGMKILSLLVIIFFLIFYKKIIKNLKCVLIYK